MSKEKESYRLSYFVKKLEDRIGNKIEEVKEQVRLYNQDVSEKRKIIVRFGYITKMKLGVRSIYASYLATREAGLLDVQTNEPEEFKGQYVVTLDNVKLAKGENAKKMQQYEDRLQAIETVKQEREKENAKEKLTQMGYQIPDEVQPIEQIKPEMNPVGVNPMNAGNEVSEGFDKPIQLNMGQEEVQSNDVPINLTDEQINNVKANLQQMDETSNGGDGITAEQPAEVAGNVQPTEIPTIDSHVESTITEVQASMAQDLQEMGNVGENIVPALEENEEEIVTPEIPVVQPIAESKPETPQNNIEVPQEQPKNNEVNISNGTNDLINEIGNYVRTIDDAIAGMQKAALASLAIEQSKNDKLMKENETKDIEIKSLKEKYDTKEIEVQNLTVINTHKDKQIEVMKTDISDREVTIQKLTKENADKDLQISSLEKERENDQIRIQNGMEAVKAKDEEIARLQQNLSTIQKQYSHLADMIAAASSQLSQQSLENVSNEEGKAPYQKS